MSNRTTAIGTQTTSDTLSAAEYNDAAGGWIGYVAITSSAHTSVTTDVDITGLAVTVTVGTSRRIRVSGHVRVSCSSDVGGTTISLWEGATLLDKSDNYATVADGRTHCDPIAVLTPTAGSHTYKLSIANAFAGNSAVRADPTFPCFLMVEDVGPA